MAYVYKYIDRCDGQVKYVGIIKTESNFPARFTQHGYDYWFNDGEWEIFYTETKTSADAEVLEAHLITLYGTEKWFNKKKTGWGLCSFVDESSIKWIKLEGFGNKNRFIHSYRKSPTEIVMGIKEEVNRCYSTIAEIRSQLHVYSKELVKYKRASIREWFEIVGLDELHQCTHMTSEKAFDSYRKFRRKYEFSLEGLFDFIDKEEFWKEVPFTLATDQYCYKEYLTLDRSRLEREVIQEWY